MQSHWLPGFLGVFDGVMKISFNTLTLPQVYVARNVNKKRLNPSLAILKTQCSGDLPESNQIVSGSSAASNRREIPIGIIGGVSVLSTLVFLEKLVWWSSRNGGESVPFIVCSDPVKIPTINGRHGTDPLNHDLIIENLKQKRVFLEQSGARCIVMPCHISHVWHEELSQGCSVPFLHVGDCVAREIKDAKFKPLEAGSNVQIGILARDSTPMEELYNRKLRSQGFEVVLPDKPTMEHAVIPAIEALTKKDMEGARNLLRIAIHGLLMRAVNTVILAADEFRDVLPIDDPVLKRCIDPMDALARSTLTWAQANERVHKQAK